MKLATFRPLLMQSIPGYRLTPYERCDSRHGRASRTRSRSVTARPQKPSRPGYRRGPIRPVTRVSRNRLGHHGQLKEDFKPFQARANLLKAPVRNGRAAHQAASNRARHALSHQPHEGGPGAALRPLPR